MAGGLIDLLKDGLGTLSSEMAARIRLENPAYACRPVDEIARNCAGLVEAWMAYVEIGDWAPVHDQTMKVIRQRLPMGFKVSDVIGALTTCEETLTEYIEEEDATGDVRSSAQYALLRATFHRTRLELVDRFIESSHNEATNLLEAAYRRSAELEARAAGARTSAHKAAAAIRDELIAGLEECVERLGGAPDGAADRVRARLRDLLASARGALEELERSP